MRQPSVEILKTLSLLNATYRFVCSSVNYIDNPIPGGVPIVDSKRPPRTFCEILDLTIPDSPPYVRAEGLDEADALDKAVAMAITAEKPRTPAQRADAERVTALVAERDARIAHLESELSAKGVQYNAFKSRPTTPPAAQAEVEPAKKRGRPPGIKNKAGSIERHDPKGPTIIPSLNMGEIPNTF